MHDTLKASGASSYTWAPSTGLSNTIVSLVVASPNVSTLYTLTATSGTCTVNNTVSVTVLSNPVAGFAYYECTCIGTNNTGFLDTTHIVSGDSIVSCYWTFSGQGYYTTSTIKTPQKTLPTGLIQFVLWLLPSMDVYQVPARL